MSRLWWRLVAYLVLLPPLAIAFMPFTERGSQLLLDNAARLLPLEIEYGGGTLAGELKLARLAWSDEGLSLEMQGILLELSPDCLWHSSICFTQLSARQLALTLLPAAADETDQSPPGDAADDEALFEFPVPLEARRLQLDAVSVVWEGGEWRQGAIEGSVSISGSTIRVGRAVVEDAELVLLDSGNASAPVQLPHISLPLELLVDELVLLRPELDLYGSKQAFESLRLSGGEWLATKLRLGKLQLHAAGLGKWQASADVEFSGQWPLIAQIDGVLPAIEGWPSAALGHTLTASASGDLAALVVQVALGDRIALAASGRLNTLDPTLPFSVELNADWSEGLALSELLALPESLQNLALTAPLQLIGSGSLDEQVFQLETTVNAPDYGALDLRLAGSHETGRLEVEDLRLRDAGGANTLWGRGEIEYAQQIQWSAVLESSGLELLPLSDYGSGYIEGQVQLLGEFAGEEWTVSLAGAELVGTLNGLPATLSGYAGIDSQLRLLPAELRAEVNGTRVQLRKLADSSQPASFDLELDDLGLWLADSHGSLSLQASVTPGWQQFDATGSLRGIEWQGLQLASGSLEGTYFSGEAASFSLDVILADLALAGIELEATELSVRGNNTTQTASLHSRGDVDGLLEVSGQRGAGSAWTGLLAATTLQTAAGNWTLSEPVAIDFAPSPSRLRLAAHCWQIGQSRICPGDILLAEEGRGSLALDGDLAALTSLLPPNLELKGVVTGQFAAAWSPAQAVTIEGELSGRDILFTRHFGAEEFGTLSWQRIDAKVHNDAGGLSLNTGVYTTDLRVIDLDLHLPADRDQPLSGALVINGLQLASLAPFAPTMSVLEGELRGELSLQGTINKPLAQGVLNVSGGHFGWLGNPTELQQLELQLQARGDEAVVQGSGMLGGGPLVVSGHLLSQPEWRLELAMEGSRHEILLPPYTQMLVSEKLDMILTGGLLHLGGDIVVHQGTLEHERLPAGGVTLSKDVVEVDLAGNVIRESAPFDISMNIGLLVEDNFKIVGDMVNAKLGGDLQLRQEPRQPLQVFGNLNVIGGELRAYQQRLRIQRGTVSFAGTPENPELDVRAQREISTDNVVVGLQLQGTLEQPKLELFSDPVMSHSETMSYLVRGRGLDSGASDDGLAMALSLGSGLVNQSAVVTELNKIPGVSNLAFGSEGTTEEDTAATVGGYIGERLYLSYGMGIYEPINVLTARLYLKTRLWLEVVSRLENSVDLYYSFDID